VRSTDYTSTEEIEVQVSYSSQPELTTRAQS
jgi:hypothetical protein